MGQRTQAQLAGARNTLIHEVTAGYYGVLQAQAFREVARNLVSRGLA